MLVRWWTSLRAAWELRRLGMLRGEAIAWSHGEEGYQRALAATHRPEAGSREHMLALWTARFARQRLDDLRGNDYASKLEKFAFDLAFADPPYDRDYASLLIRLFQTRPFARELWVEHRSGEQIPEVPGIRQRRYGDTTLSTLAADE